MMVTQLWQFAPPFEVHENVVGGMATITVTLSNTSTHTIAATVATGSGSATPNVDYSPVNATVTFAPGEQSKQVSIPIIDDMLDESEIETVHSSHSRTP